MGFTTPTPTTPSDSTIHQYSCIICSKIPEDPLQCSKCDRLMCKPCSYTRRSDQVCPNQCKDTRYGNLKQETTEALENFHLPCNACHSQIKFLEYSKHTKFCGKLTYQNNDIYAPPNYAPGMNSAPVQQVKKITPKKISENPTPTSFKKSDLKAPLAEKDDEDENLPKNRTWDWYVFLSFIGLLSVVFMAGTAFLGILLVFYNGGVRFQTVCTGDNLFEKHPEICIFSFGQFSLGIVAFGQIAVGLITFAHVGVGVLFGIGQVIASAGLSIGQITWGYYIPVAQFGLAFYRIRFAMFGWHFLYSLQTKKDIMVSCFCKDGDKSTQSVSSTSYYAGTQKEWSFRIRIGDDEL